MSSRSKSVGIPSALSLVAGASAGAVEAFATYPTEYVKMQAQFARSTIGVQTIHPSTIVRNTFRQHGVRAFYSGCTPAVIGSALKAAVRFLTYDKTTAVLRDANGKLTPARTVLAGMVAGTIESLVAVTPSETIKVRLIEQQTAPAIAGRVGTVGIVSNMVRVEGFGALYKGLAPTTLKQASNSVYRFGVYQTLKDLALQKRGGDSLPNWLTSCIGAVAGTVTVYGTMPFDVVKTRMQQRTGARMSTAKCLLDIARKDGILAFWRGSTPRVARLVISGSVSFTVYENVVHYLRPLYSR